MRFLKEKTKLFVDSFFYKYDPRTKFNLKTFGRLLNELKQ